MIKAGWSNLMVRLCATLVGRNEPAKSEQRQSSNSIVDSEQRCLFKGVNLLVGQSLCMGLTKYPAFSVHLP